MLIYNVLKQQDIDVLQGKHQILKIIESRRILL